MISFQDSSALEASVQTIEHLAQCTDAELTSKILSSNLTITSPWSRWHKLFSYFSLNSYYDQLDPKQAMETLKNRLSAIIQHEPSEERLRTCAKACDVFHRLILRTNRELPSEKQVPATDLHIDLMAMVESRASRSHDGVAQVDAAQERPLEQSAAAATDRPTGACREEPLSTDVSSPAPLIIECAPARVETPPRDVPKPSPVEMAPAAPLHSPSVDAGQETPAQPPARKKRQGKDCCLPFHMMLRPRKTTISYAEGKR